MTLSIQLAGQNEIEILFDKEGLEFLRNLFNREWHKPVPQGNLFDFDHVHLMTEEWGTGELTTEAATPEEQKIHHAKVLYLG